MRHIYKCPYNSAVECRRRPCPERCNHCGHNPVEHAYRVGYIRAGGMEKNSDGIAVIHIKREVM